MSKGIYVFGFSKKEVTELRNIAAKNKFAICSVITRNMANMKVEDIISYKSSGLMEEQELNNEAFLKEKVVLFNNFSDSELDNIIRDIRNHSELHSILAVITPTSKQWTFRYLLEHLIEEREWHAKNSNQ